MLYGIKFVRTDLEEEVIIDAHVDHVLSTDRGTSLSFNGAVINTTEHVLAAVSGLQVDNLLITVNAEETPIMDGSSAPFIFLLKSVGIKEQRNLKRFVVIKKPFKIQ